MAAISVVLSPKLLTQESQPARRVSARLEGSESGGAQPEDKADCSCSAGTQPCCSQEASPRGK